MNNIETFGYKITKKLGESLHSEVFQVYGEKTPHDLLVLKRIKKTHIEFPDLFNFLKQQIDSLNKSNIPGTIIPKLFSPEKDVLYLVCKYFDGLKLNSWRQSQKKQILILSLIFSTTLQTF